MHPWLHSPKVLSSHLVLFRHRQLQNQDRSNPNSIILYRSWKVSTWSIRENILLWKLPYSRFNSHIIWTGQDQWGLNGPYLSFSSQLRHHFLLKTFYSLPNWIVPLWYAPWWPELTHITALVTPDSYDLLHWWQWWLVHYLLAFLSFLTQWLANGSCSIYFWGMNKWIYQEAD